MRGGGTERKKVMILALITVKGTIRLTSESQERNTHTREAITAPTSLQVSIACVIGSVEKQRVTGSCARNWVTRTSLLSLEPKEELSKNFICCEAKNEVWIKLSSSVIIRTKNRKC